MTKENPCLVGKGKRSLLKTGGVLGGGGKKVERQDHDIVNKKTKAIAQRRRGKDPTTKYEDQHRLERRQKGFQGVKGGSVLASNGKRRKSRKALGN